MGLLDEVLFIEDANEKGKYHPRISAQFTYSYRALNDYEKWCYDRMYKDFKLTKLLKSILKFSVHP